MSECAGVLNHGSTLGPSNVSVPGRNWRSCSVRQAGISVHAPPGWTPPEAAPARHGEPEPVRAFAPLAARLDLADLEPDVPEERTEEESERRWREKRARERAWRNKPRDERERLVLEALRDDSLTMLELLERMRAELPEFDLYDSKIRPLVTGLVKGGELDRRPDPRWNGRVRWLYFRARDLKGPIADLERAFHDDQNEAG